MVLLLACTGTEPTPTPTESTPVEIDPRIELDDAWVSALEGRWSGSIDPTPIGEIPQFPMNFEWQDDGSLFTHSQQGDFYVDFRFRKDAEARWVLDEEAQIDVDNVQGYTLAPIAQDDDAVTFSVIEAEGYLLVDWRPEADTLVVEVTLGGEQHVVFDMAR